MSKLKKDAGSPDTPVRSKKRTSARQVLRISLGAAVTFLITTFALGYVLGWYNSPNWEDPLEVKKFMRKHYIGRFVGPAGRQQLPESDPIELRLRLADRELVYRTDTEEITEEELLPDLQALPNQRRQSKDRLVQAAEALGGSAGSLLAKVHVPLGNWLGIVPKGRFVAFAAATVVLGAGAVWGYSMGFSEAPDYSSKPFQEWSSDKALWRRLEEHYRTKSSRAPSSAAPSATP